MKSSSPITSHWNANEYSKNSQFQYELGMAMLAEYKFKGDEHVLDVGCGDGKTTYQIALRVPDGNVTGIDSSESMIQFAKKNYTTQKNLSFELKDAQKLNYEKHFDLVTSLCCLQWVPDKFAAFKEIRKSLKPQGKSILIIPFINDELTIIKEQMIHDSRWEKYFINYFNPSIYIKDTQYEKFARDAGLVINSYAIKSVTSYFKTAQDLGSFLRNITSRLNQLPDENTKIAFMNEVLERYLKLVPPKDGLCQITYSYAKMFASV